MADKDKTKGAEAGEEEKGKKGKKEKKEKPEKEKKKKKNQGEASEDADAPEGKKKKEKPEKAPKERKERKSHPVLMTMLFVNIGWLLLLSAFSFLVIVDAQLIFDRGLKEIVVEFFFPDMDPDVIFASERDFYQTWEKDLENTATDLDVREKELDVREEDINNQEYELESLRLELEEKYPSAMGDDTQLSVSDIDISGVASSLASMDAANAANLLINASEDYAVAVLRAMKKDVRGEILDAMTTVSVEEAARIFEALLAQE